MPALGGHIGPPLRIIMDPIKAYLKEIKNIALLTAQEEVDLARLPRRLQIVLPTVRKTVAVAPRGAAPRGR